MIDQQQRQQARKAGRVMVFGFWLLLLIAMAWWFEGLLEGMSNPNTDPESSRAADGTQEVLLQSNNRRHYVATGFINGREARFLLDTGATLVAVPLSLADRFQLKRGSVMHVMTANGPARAYATSIDRISLGGIELRDVRASINPGLDSDTVLLGMSFLGQLEMRQEDGTLLLRQNP